MKVRWKQRGEGSFEEARLIIGLPDVGFVGKQAVDYLVSELKPTLLYDVYSDHFPPQVVITREGLIETLKCQLYGWKNPTGKGDLLIFTGNAQPVSPEGQHVLAQELLSRAEKLGLREVYSLTGHLVEYRPPEKEPTVYAVATSHELLNELKAKYGLSTLEKGKIEGVQGLIIGEAKFKGFKGVCLLAETPGYSTPSGRPVVDAKASRALLQVLLNILEVKLDLSGLERQVALTEEFMEKLAELEQRVLEQVLRSGRPSEREKQYYV
ncbi:MAG: PAC2 family protein [Candidatus Hecatellaceae archaeon]